MATVWRWTTCSCGHFLHGEGPRIELRKPSLPENETIIGHAARVHAGEVGIAFEPVQAPALPKDGGKAGEKVTVGAEHLPRVAAVALKKEFQRGAKAALPFEMKAFALVPADRAELHRRIASMEKELTYAKLCDHQIVNQEGKLSETIEEVEKSIFEGD